MKEKPVDARFYFFLPTKDSEDSIAAKLLFMGYDILHTRNLNENISLDAPFRTDEEKDASNKEFIKYCDLGIPIENIPEEEPRRERLPFHLIAERKMIVNVDEIYRLYDEFTEMANDHGGDYDGHEYEINLE